MVAIKVIVNLKGLPSIMNLGKWHLFSFPPSDPAWIEHTRAKTWTCLTKNPQASIRHCSQTADWFMLFDIFPELVKEQRQPFSKLPQTLQIWFLGLLENRTPVWTKETILHRQMECRWLVLLQLLMFKEIWLEKFHYLNHRKGLERLMKYSRQTMGLWLPHHSCGSEQAWDSPTFQPSSAKHKDLKSFPVACIKIVFFIQAVPMQHKSLKESRYAHIAFNLINEHCPCGGVCEIFTRWHSQPPWSGGGHYVCYRVPSAPVQSFATLQLTAHGYG